MKLFEKGWKNDKNKMTWMSEITDMTGWNTKTMIEMTEKTEPITVMIEIITWMIKKPAIISRMTGMSKITDIILLNWLK